MQLMYSSVPANWTEFQFVGNDVETKISQSLCQMGPMETHTWTTRPLRAKLSGSAEMIEDWRL